MKIIIGFIFALFSSFIIIPSAAADINISGVNIGNQGNAEASFGNVAIATTGSTAKATGGVGNVAFATGGSVASKQGPGSFNAAVATGQGGAFIVDGSGNLALAANGGTARATGSSLTANVALGRSGSQPSLAESTGVIGSVQTAICGGTTTSAQGRIEVDAPCLRRN